MNKLLIATLIAAGLSSAAPQVFAQATPQATTPQAGATGPGAGRHHQGKRVHRMPSERMEARLAYIHTALKITDAQKPQWESFATAMRAQARDADKHVQARHARMSDPSKRAQRPTGIERLEFRQKMMAARAERLNTLIAAGKPLYATFTPQQKEVADSLLAPRHGKGQHHGRGMRSNA